MSITACAKRNSSLRLRFAMLWPALFALMTSWSNQFFPVLLMGVLAGAWGVGLGGCTPRDSRLASLPAPVRRTAETVLGSGRLEEVTLTNDNGQQVYEFEARLRGRDRSFTIATNGSLLSRQLYLEEVPAAVCATVERQTGEGVFEALYWTNEEGEPAYYVEWLDHGQKRSFVVAPDGWLASRQVTLAETPALVQAALRGRFRDPGTLQIDHACDGEEDTYEVLESVSGQNRVWVFGTNGTVAAEPVTWAEMPEPVRAALARASAGSRVAHLFKFTYEGRLLYEVSFVRQEARHVYTVDTTGHWVSEEMPLAELPPPLRSKVTAATAGRFILRVERSVTPAGVAEYEVTSRLGGKVQANVFPAGEASTTPTTPKKNTNKKFRIRL
jgi:hypothetical protein